MALKRTVKVTINNLSDARYCAGMGVDLIGYSIDPEDPFYLSPENFKEIAEWLSGVSFVAEVADKRSLPEEYYADFIQVNDPSVAGFYPNHKVIIHNDLPNMRKWREELQKLPNLSFMLINIDEHKAEFKEIIEEFSEFQLLIGFDLSLDDVEELVKYKATGIALKGGHEIKPGLKDYNELADILESLEVDNPY